MPGPPKHTNPRRKTTPAPTRPPQPRVKNTTPTTTSTTRQKPPHFAATPHQAQPSHHAAPRARADTARQIRQGRQASPAATSPAPVPGLHAHGGPGYARSAAPRRPFRGTAPVASLAQWKRMTPGERAKLLVRQYEIDPSGRSGPLSHLMGDVGHRSGSAQVLGALERYVVKPLEAGAPIVAPYAAFAVVIALCPECIPAATLAAGGASFAAHRSVEHESRMSSLLNAAIDAVGSGGGEVAQRALIREIDQLLVGERLEEARGVMIEAILHPQRYDQALAFRHR